MSTNRIATRMSRIQPFRVMELLARARELEAAGRSIVHMEVGEPDFVTPEPIIAAGRAALEDGHTHYTPAAGLMELRIAISDFYRQRYQVDVSPHRIIVTPGASGALQLALGVLINPGEQVLMADPGYPCNRNFVYLLNGEPVSVQVNAETDRLIGIEGLVRWQHPNMGIVLPEQFIPLLEKMGLIIQLDQWVMKKAMGQIVQWYRQGLNPGVLSLNLAIKQLEQKNFIDTFKMIIEETGCKHEWVELEVTEGQIMNNPDK